MNTHYKVTFRHFSRVSSGTLRHPRKRALLASALASALAATLVMALAVELAATGAAPHAGEPGQVTVLNPKSYPLVGGTWTVDLDIRGGGSLGAAAAEGTEFGGDLEFARLYHHDTGEALQPSRVGEGGALFFDDVPEGQWAFEVAVFTAGPHHLRFEMGAGDARADNTASLAYVNSTTADGTYYSGEIIDVHINFTEPVALDQFRIAEGRQDAASGTFTELHRPVSITTITIDGSLYALVASEDDDGVQIIDITDPADPKATASAVDGHNNRGVFPRLGGAHSVTTITIDSFHYALVASSRDDGVQIINITDPADPLAVAAIRDGGTDLDGGTFAELSDVRSVTTATIGGTPYALVAGYGDDGVQIINITNPANPLAVAAIVDGSTFAELNGAFSVTTAVINSTDYALVASYDDDGVQIINITDPAVPVAVAAIDKTDTDSAGGTFADLDGALYIQ